MSKKKTSLKKVKPKTSTKEFHNFEIENATGGFF
jgi:hypothetical protein